MDAGYETPEEFPLASDTNPPNAPLVDHGIAQPAHFGPVDPNNLLYAHLLAMLINLDEQPRPRPDRAG
jgi:hypothetical protein